MPIYLNITILYILGVKIVEEEKRPLGKFRRRMENSIKMDRIGTGSKCVVWIHLA
jgi:hypothetical protein